MTEATADAGTEKIDTTTQTTTTPADNKAGVSDSKDGASTATETGATATATAETGETAGERDRDYSGKFKKNWRDRYANGDKEVLKRLERFSDEDAFFKSYRTLEDKFRSGEYKPATPFPEKGTDEQKAEWRKAQGVPDAPDKYDVAVGDGFVWGEADKPLLSNFTAWAHANNYSQAEVTKNLRWYNQMQQEWVRAQQEADGVFFKDSEDTLRAEWGPEYRTNINIMENWLNNEPSEIREVMLAARTPDGRKLAAHPAIVKWMAQTGKALSPEATLLPEGGADAKSVDTQIEDIKKIARETPDKYDRAMEAKHIELLGIKERMQKRGRAA